MHWSMIIYLDMIWKDSQEIIWCIQTLKYCRMADQTTKISIFFKLGDISINIFPFESQLLIVTCNIVWSLNKSHKQTWRFCPMLLNIMYMVANRKNSVCFVHPAFLYRSLNPSNKNMDVAARNAPITFNVYILMPARNLTWFEVLQRKKCIETLQFPHLHVD